MMKNGWRHYSLKNLNIGTDIDKVNSSRYDTLNRNIALSWEITRADWKCMQCANITRSNGQQTTFDGVLISSDLDGSD